MEPVLEGLTLIIGLENIALIFGGVLIGVLVGALPGLSSPMAVALLLLAVSAVVCGPEGKSEGGRNLELVSPKRLRRSESRSVES